MGLCPDFMKFLFQDKKVSLLRHRRASGNGGFNLGFHTGSPLQREIHICTHDHKNGKNLSLLYNGRKGRLAPLKGLEALPWPQQTR